MVLLLALKEDDWDRSIQVEKFSSIMAFSFPSFNVFLFFKKGSIPKDNFQYDMFISKDIEKMRQTGLYCWFRYVLEKGGKSMFSN